MKKTGRKAVMVTLFLISALLLLFFIWCMMSPGRIRTYDGPKSLSEKFVTDINGSPNGFFINSQNTDNPVLLFVSSGPGTDDYFLTEKYKDMKLEEEFTVVYWDYRDMGIAYDKSFDTDKITLENILEDTETVTDYLKTRFGKDKLFIMGFSGGTHIALQAAREHPEDYYALINMAQVVTDGPEQDALMYDFMKRIFMDRDDSASLKKLEESVKKTEDGRIICKDWYNYIALLHKAGGGTIKDKSEFEGIVLPILFSRCYTVKEKLQYVPAMKMYRKTPFAEELAGFDYRESVTALEIPAYFISGESDYNCPWELVKDDCDIIDAPDKEFFLIPDSAHSPLWENPSVTCDALRQIKERTANE
jgi:pimeloyl-ACP methyl ester carboxylesterase